MIAADANDPKGIVWVASYPRSGNTWIQIFLHHILRIRRGMPALGNEIERIEDTVPSMAGEVELFAEYAAKPLPEASMHDIVLARPKVAEAMVRRATGVLPVRTHSVMGRIFDTPLINLGVSVGAIYIVRNPLDVAVSLSDYMARPIDATIATMAAHLNASPTTGELVAEIWGSWSENVGSWTAKASPVIKVVRYEDLLDDPIAGFGAIAEHMRIGAAPDEIEEAVRLSSFAELPRRDAAGRPEWIDRFFRTGRAGQWRERLNPQQVERIVSDHHEQMARFGYLPNEPLRVAS